MSTNHASITEAQPLSGRCIVVTRPRTQASRFVDLLEQYGAEVIQFPTIETIPVESYERLDTALDELATYHWLIFTSVNGVKYLLARLQARQQDMRSLEGIQIAAIGPETARAVEAVGLQVAAVPEEYRAEAVVPILGDVAGRRILLPRAAGAREVLPQELQALGAQVDEIPIYQTVLPQNGRTKDLQALLQKGKIDLVTFTSSSTVRNFASLFPQQELLALMRTVRIGCIGPITAETVREYGLEVAIQSSVYTIPAFAETIVEHFSHQLSAISYQQDKDRSQ
jgi:uroporphyrinogen III methyltransferase/synthase